MAMADSIFISPGQSQTVTNIIISGTGYFADGSVGSPSRTYTLDTDLGSYRIGANNEGFTAGGALIFDYNASRVNFAQPITGTDIYGSGLLAVGSGGTARFTSGADGILNILNGAQNSGVRFDVITTDGTLKLLSRAGADTAILSANQFQTTLALIATGGGGGNPALVVASTGGTNQPTTAAQNGWMKAKDSTGATIWIPVWK